MEYGSKISVLKAISGLLICTALSGCGVPLFPIPIIKFAPPTEMLPEKAEAPLVLSALKTEQGIKQNVAMSMRSGRVLVVEPRKSDAELLASLPSAELKQEFSSAYVSAFKFRQLKAGTRHYYNFTITPEFERATSLYLNGQGEEAIEQIERILTDKKNEPTLLWQASYLKINVLIMMGRPDAAERETVRLEALEIAAMGKNHTTRALRAEVKYWAGDIEGALEDAAQVVRAFGTWRYTAAYSTPPLDQVELARCVTAQARADIVLGLALLSKGQVKAALRDTGRYNSDPVFRAAADAAHRAGGTEIGLPLLHAAELRGGRFPELRGGIEGAFAAEVLEIELVQAHPVPLPAEATLQLGVLRGGRLPLGEHRAEKIRQLVRVRHVPLVEREVVFQERLAETVHADQCPEILRNVRHHVLLSRFLHDTSS